MPGRLQLQPFQPWAGNGSSPPALRGLCRSQPTPEIQPWSLIGSQCQRGRRHHVFGAGQLAAPPGVSKFLQHLTPGQMSRGKARRRGGCREAIAARQGWKEVLQITTARQPAAGGDDEAAPSGAAGSELGCQGCPPRGGPPRQGVSWLHTSAQP